MSPGCWVSVVCYGRARATDQVNRFQHLRSAGADGRLSGRTYSEDHEMTAQRIRLLSPQGLGQVALAVLPVVAASVLGQIATFPNLAPWYAGLVKPAFNPPNWIFGPVWTTLYVLMAYAAWRILRLPEATPGRSTALTLFFLQLVLNAAWSWMFFYLHSPLLGVLNIGPQWLVILATIGAFWRLDRLAGACLVPLAAWVGFASVLNFTLWQLNG
ncbi:tryptophan-rich sensory protein [Azorhizobium caulinodans ORS 571]|uniref:Tryptophan-rich sensory protein n=2 Tax=Azorhizobium caulinodans TaxID=7 RepID=A8I6N9_AZOC5|nr:tryptophan-rich sensory protein [Azorhizobium caulinodans ORS 571]